MWTKNHNTHANRLAVSNRRDAVAHMCAMYVTWKNYTMADKYASIHDKLDSWMMESFNHKNLG